MSLLTEAFEPCVIMDKVTDNENDGYGGINTTWKPGASFEAAFVLDNSMEAQVAMQQGVTSVYTITTRKDVILWPLDVFRREKDGQTFRVTSDGQDKKTPASATLDMRQVRAEKWNI